MTCPVPSRPYPQVRALTFVLLFELLLQQVCLPVAQHEGEEGQDERIEDPDDGQNVRPAHRTVPQGILPRLGPAHVPDGLGVPAIGEDHAAQHEAQSWAWGAGPHRGRVRRKGGKRRYYYFLEARRWEGAES